MNSTLEKKPRVKKSKSGYVTQPVELLPAYSKPAPEATLKKSAPRLDQMDDRMVISAIMNTMRILKPNFWEDTFYETYAGMIRKYQPFFDIYMLAWNIGTTRPAKRVLEVGPRTGTALCQLLSAYMDINVFERADLVDTFGDGFSKPERIIKNLYHLNLPFAPPQINIHVDSSLSVLPRLLAEGKTYDYILIDGDHDYGVARSDLNNSVPLCEPGGVILFDDVSDSPGECGLIKVFDLWKEDHKGQFDFYTNMCGKGTAWAIKRE